MSHMHNCYIENGSIINNLSNTIIEQPALLISKDSGCLHGWGESENVKARFAKFITAYTKAGMRDEINDLTLIELSQFKISREMACYILRRAVEFTATGFTTELCEQLTSGKNPLAWLKNEMSRIPINIYEKNWD